MNDMPVFGTIASQFNDPGMNSLYKAIMNKLVEKTGVDLNSSIEIIQEMSEKIFIIPPARIRYLSEIAENIRAYDKKERSQVKVAQKLFGIYKTIDSILSTKSLSINQKEILTKTGLDHKNILEKTPKNELPFIKLLINQFEKVKMDLDPYNWEIILSWYDKIERYKAPIYTFKVRDKNINIETHSESLSHSKIPKISLPKYEAWGDVLRWNLQEMFQENFLLQQVCTLLSELEKTQRECLPERVVLREPIDVFIMLVLD
jgi:methylmalonyl-CoA mutase